MSSLRSITVNCLQTSCKLRTRYNLLFWLILLLFLTYSNCNNITESIESTSTPVSLSSSTPVSSLTSTPVSSLSSTPASYLTSTPAYLTSTPVSLTSTPVSSLTSAPVYLSSTPASSSTLALIKETSNLTITVNDKSQPAVTTNLNLPTLTLSTTTTEESNVIAKKSNVVAKESNIVAEESNVVAKESNVVVKEFNVVAKESNVVAKESNVVAEESNVIAKESNVVAKESNVVAKESNVVAKESNVVAKESNVVAKESNVVTKESNVVAKESNAVAKESNVIAKESNVVVKESNVIAKESNVVAKESNVVAKESNVVAKESNVVAKESNVIAKESNVVAKESNVVAKESNLVTKESNVVAKESNVVTKESNVVAKESNLVTKESNVSESSGNGGCHNVDEFRCVYSQECIPNIWKCDHTVDCADGSDEWPDFSDDDFGNDSDNESIPGTVEEEETLQQQQQRRKMDESRSSCNHICGQHQFKCHQSNECIPRGWLCDGQFDCGNTELGPDRSDETGNELNCDETMNELPLDKEGLGPNNLTVPLLLETTKPYLILYNQSFMISLVRPFANLSQQFHYNFSQRVNKINNEETLDISVMLTTTRDSNLCWIDKSFFAIRCVPVLLMLHQNNNSPNDKQPSSGEATLENYGVPPIETIYKMPAYIKVTWIRRIILDWLTDNWYLLDTQNQFIYLCSHHFDSCLIVADHTVIGRPLCLELDPAEGLLFISQLGNKPRMSSQSEGPSILKAKHDGSQMSTLVDVRLVRPSHLTLDAANRRLYWIDTYLNLLESVDYNGQNRLLIRNRTPNNHFAWSQTISMFSNENIVYLLVRNNNNNNNKVGDKNSADTVRFVSLHLKQNAMTSKTFRSNVPFEKAAILNDITRSSVSKFIKLLCVKCGDQLCIPKFDHELHQMIKVECHQNNETIFEPSNNRSTSTELKTFMVYSRDEPSLIKIINLPEDVDNEGGSDQIEETTPTNRSNSDHLLYHPIPFSQCPIAFDIDPYEKNIYYLDDHNVDLLINRLFMNRSSPIKQIKLKRRGIDQVESMAFDWMTANLYVLQSKNTGSILATSFQNDTFNMKTLINGLKNPKALTLDPLNGLMFFSQYGTLISASIDEQTKSKASIHRASMDGTNVITLVSGSNLKWPNSLALDPIERKLYWCDHHRIERIAYNGTNRELLLEGPRVGIHNSLAFHAGYLYWTELQHGTIQRLDIANNRSVVILQEDAPLYQIKITSPLPYDSIDRTIRDSFHCHQLTLRNQYPTQFSCACFNGFSLNLDNGQSCRPIEPEEPNCKDDYFLCPIANKCLPKGTLCSIETVASATNNINNQESSIRREDFTQNSKNWTGTVTCNRKEFRCDRETRCIPFHWLCDGHRDCHDWTDEVSCKNSTCPTGNILCQIRPICIDESWRCDGELDCGPDDGSDEQQCQQNGFPQITVPTTLTGHHNNNNNNNIDDSNIINNNQL